VIAGQAKGQLLGAPQHGTRPTTDRVREALFSALADWNGTGGAAAENQLDGCSFLDLYAGSGSVGIEAASRGAEPVVAVEQARSAVKVLQANVESTNQAVMVVQSSVQAFLASPRSENWQRGFDIVWLDPPFNLDEASLSANCQGVLLGGWLAPGGLVVVQRSSRSPAPDWPADLADRWVKRYGESLVHFAQADDEEV